jgi:hypothetical protein
MCVTILYNREIQREKMIERREKECDRQRGRPVR